MVFQNEIITLLLGAGVAVLILLKWSSFKQIAHFRVLALAYLILMGAWVATNAEGIGWESSFNVVEHLCYFASSVVVAFWCWTALCRHGGARP